MPQGMFGRWRGSKTRAATSEMVYSADEVEFMMGCDHWKRQHGGRMPNCADVLNIARRLGWRKLPLEERTMNLLDILAQYKIVRDDLAGGN